MLHILSPQDKTQGLGGKAREAQVSEGQAAVVMQQRRCGRTLRPQVRCLRLRQLRLMTWVTALAMLEEQRW